MRTKFIIIIILVFSIVGISFGQTVRVGVIGDFGAATMGPPHINNEAAVADLVKSWDTPNEPLDGILTVGDNNYPDGLSTDIETNIGQFYGEYIKGHPDFSGGNNRFFPSIGNHDYGTHDCNIAGNPYPYINYFDLPGNELYYDYVIGNVHFFVVDSDCHAADGVNAWSVQAQWLETQMTNSPHPWKIVYFHHAPYSSTPAGNSGYLQWDFKEWGATAIISGHYHLYERLQVDGLTYFVNGIGGNSLHNFTNVLPYSQVRYNQKHGAMLLTFSGNEANFKTLNIDHEVIDDYTIVKNNIPPTNNGDCNSISEHTKLGEWNGKGYFISNEKSNWEDAQSKSEVAGGYLVSIETQAEKDFLNQFISGNNGEQVIYTGLKRNNNNELEWTSGENFNINNYSVAPWGSSNSYSNGERGTIKKWNPNNDPYWGMESGNAYRKYFLEKTCTVDCSNQGGDNDGDGICNNDDCAPDDPSLPAPVGSSCNDNNANTINDIIQSNGCTCLGESNPVSNNDCTTITNYTKLGEFNGKGYFRSNFNSQGWEDAQVQCLLQDGHLISIETQAEKDFIDQHITGIADNVMYIGVKRGEFGLLAWASGETFNLNNYDGIPWESGANPSSELYGTLRKWNPNNPVVWGTESGQAYRKFILEKTCALDCTNQGGDSDNDGVCDSQDCAPNDANFPMPFGTPCDDGDSNTSDDIIMEDGCNCMGTPNTGLTPCDDILIKTENGKIIITNVNAPIAIIKVYNSTWDKVYECNNNCTYPVSVNDLMNGIYHIEIQLFDATWNQVCIASSSVNIFANLIDPNQNEINFNISRNNTSKNNITTFPNPAQNHLSVGFGTTNKKVKNILIYDNTGKLIQQFNYQSAVQGLIKINTKSLAEGVYLINVEIEGEPSISKRFVIKR